MSYLEARPIDATKVDPVLSEVVIYTSHGLPQSMKDLPDDLQPCLILKEKQACHRSRLIVWGLHVFILQKF